MIKKIYLIFYKIILIFFFSALVSSFIIISYNNYLKHKMYRTITIVIQKQLNQFLLAAFIISLLLSTLYLATRLFANINLIKKIIKTNLVTRKYSTLIKYLFIYLILWYLTNNHFKPSKIYTVTYLFDVLLLLVVILGYILETFKNKTKKILKNPKHAVIFLIIVLIFASFNIIQFINNQKSLSPERPNVVLIVVDTLRSDHISCYNYKRITTPNIDNFSRDCTLFKNIITMAPWTTPAVASLMTFQYPRTLGFKDSAIVLDNKFLTISEIFRENNYRTKGIISHAFLTKFLGFSQGFESYDEENAKGHGYISSPSVTKKAISYLRKNKKSNFFLFLHYFDPHYNYIMHKDYNYFPDYDGPIESGQHVQTLREIIPYLTNRDLDYVKALYDSEIRFTDHYIGKVIDELKSLGIYDNTIIVLTGDHGEEFCERGQFWIGHTKTLYQELIHVPLLIKDIKKDYAKTVSDYYGLIDLGPTILNTAGLKIPKSYKNEGKIIDNNSQKNNRPIFTETKRWAKKEAVINGHWKFIHNLYTKSFELYNLKSDPHELNNLLFKKNKKAKKLRILLMNWNKRTRKLTIKTKKPEFTEEQKKHLKSLGYI